MGLIRTIIMLALLGGFAYCGATVDLGERTLFQHVAQIWSTDETQDLVDGVKDTGEPLMERLQRGIEAGLEEARGEEKGSEENGVGETESPEAERADASGASDASEGDGAEDGDDEADLEGENSVREADGG